MGALSGDAPPGYGEWLAGLKATIRQARVQASLSVNAELIALYWRIGRDILDRQGRGGWGSKVVERLAADLRAEFPDMRGLSRANLLYMRAFAEAWPDLAVVQRVVGRLPWEQNIELLAKLKDLAARLWYAEATLEHGWSRSVLSAQIETGLRERQGQAVTNFGRTLPPAHSDMAQQILKDPCHFDVLSLAAEAKERDVERGLLARVKDVLLEMGKGFAFVASQHHLEVGGQDWYVDLLFYHRRLRCLVAVDLKVGAFQPEHAGKMNFYLAALDDQSRVPAGTGPLHLVLDSTGLELFGQGEWCAAKHGRLRRRWLKLHAGVDATTGEIAAHVLTEGDEDDAAQAPALLRQCEDAIASLTADGAYDRDPVYQAAMTRQPRSPPEVIIPPRADAVLSTADPDRQTSRDRHIQLLAERGRMGWQRTTGYGRRNHVETTMDRYKHLIGPKLRARSRSGRNGEVALAIQVLNRMIHTAKPVSIPR